MLRKVLLDKLIGCKTTERGGYFVKEEKLWRETEFYCERCQKVFFRSQRRVKASEFWEDDVLYTIPMADSATGC
jgi:hypothetical protein